MAIAGTCFGDVEQEAELNGAAILNIKDRYCVHKTYAYKLVHPPPFEGLEEHSVYQPCVRNELCALLQRHLLTNGEPQDVVWERCLRISASLANSLSIDRPYTPEEVIAHKNAPGNKRRYRRAFHVLRTIGLPPRYNNVKAFVKVEKWPVSSLGIKPPRLIQYRSFEYCAALSRYLMPMEKSLWSYREPDTGLPPFAKGMNTFQVASVLRDMESLYDDPVFVLADHSKFDSTIMGRWIELEKRAYTSIYPDEELQALMSDQFVNKGQTKHGISYTCLGRKMSGEYNTSLGDTWVNYCILKDVFKDVPHHVLVNGDDSVIVMPASKLADLDLSPETWLQYGMTTKVDLAYDLSSVDFCQSRPVEVRPGVWRMVRLPMRAMSRALISAKRYQGQAWRRLVRSIGMSEMACSDGVPVLQSFAQHYLRLAGDVKPLMDEVSYKAKLEPRLTPSLKPITPEARLSFAAAFGIAADEQEAMERWLDTAPNAILPLSQPWVGEFTLLGLDND